MPLYEYRCSDCEHRFELLQRLGDGAEGLACPVCEGSRLEKQFSTFAASSAGAAGAAATCDTGGCNAGSGFT